ncbi:histidine kinase [Actinoallomurus sp. NBC_01490]|uniref:GAF domain-containing sensor histidine kinase n=1 Tax=Actinoallomurus sp. NBC_01490 TaxID=2903557 RepID=UPI002E3102D2|nr:ATP-binding protein [Actinoallomurus sp. NBC_01490]
MRPSVPLGVLVLVVGVPAETVLVALLSMVTSVLSLDVVYLFGVVLISAVWGLGLGLVAAAASAVAFGLYFATSTPNPHGMWIMLLANLVAYSIVAVLSCSVCASTRLLAREVDARVDADLSATLARLLLRAPDLRSAMPAAARGLARTLGLPSASIHPGSVRPREGHTAFPLRGDGMLATLIVPADVTGSTLRRLRDRAVPSLELLLGAAHERERTADALRVSRDQLQRIVDEQTSLRHLATLVACGAPPTEVFDAVAREMGMNLGVEHTVVVRYRPDDTAVVTAGSWNYQGIVEHGSHWVLEPGTVTELVHRTRSPARVSAYTGDGALSKRLRDRGIVSSVGCPIMVGSFLWGIAIASSKKEEPLPPDTERRMHEFTELASAAIANAQSHTDLIASRARVVAAADETRRRIERDLHDGTQQHLVTIALDMRGIEVGLPPELDETRHRLSGAARALEEALAELREISRGLHPAILAKGGLKVALTALAGRSSVPVELAVNGTARLPERVEVSIYYVVSEALTNAAKHANATAIRVDLSVEETVVRLSVRDDGAGGADPNHGSGLTGLSDRVQALGGRLQIISRPGEGTTLFAEIPYQP